MGEFGVLNWTILEVYILGNLVGGWFVVPGRVDKISYLLLVFLALTLLFLFGFERLI